MISFVKHIKNNNNNNMFLSWLLLCIWKWNKQKEISSWSQYLTGTICNLIRHPGKWQRAWKATGYVFCDTFKQADAKQHQFSPTHISSLSLPPHSLFLKLQKLLVGYLSFLFPPALLYTMMKRFGKWDMARTGTICWGKSFFWLFMDFFMLGPRSQHNQLQDC